MYVRKKHNRSGSTSVVVVSKASGKYKEIKSFGSSTSEEEIHSLCDKAAAWIRSFGGQQELDFDDRKGKEVEETERFLSNIDNVLINGTRLLLDQVYDSIGFNRIPDEILRHLVIARVSQPRSKLATVDYLKSYYDEDVALFQVEDFLYGDGYRRVVGIDLHDVGHHVPPFLRYRVYIVGVLAVGVLGALLVGEENVCVLVPENAVVAYACILNHLFQFRPDGSVPLGILFLASGLEEHLKSKSFHCS